MPFVKKNLTDPRSPIDGFEALRRLALPKLLELLDRERDGRVREAALTRLARMNSSESFDAILRYLRADDAAVRTAALDALKLMPELANRRLDALLHDEDADVRLLACDLARVAPPEIAQKSLAAILHSEPDVNVCAAAIELLAEIGTPEILPDLVICGERFSARFLDFSIEIARARIEARSAEPRA